MAFVPFPLPSILLSETGRGQRVSREALVSEPHIHTAVACGDAGPGGGGPPATNLLCQLLPVGGSASAGAWWEAGGQEEGDRLACCSGPSALE